MRGNGKENGNYYSRLGLYRGKRMESSVVYQGYRGNIGIGLVGEEHCQLPKSREFVRVEDSRRRALEPLLL